MVLDNTKCKMCSLQYSSVQSSTVVSLQVKYNLLLCHSECSTVYFFCKNTLLLYQVLKERRKPSADLTNTIMLKDPQQLS